MKTLAFLLLVVTFVVASGCSDTKTVPLVSDAQIQPPKIITLGGSTSFSGGGGGGGGGGGPGSGAPGQGSIYVSSVTPGRSILRFRFADLTNNVSITQNIQPASEITGPNTQLASVVPSLQVDTTNDRLYVLDLGRVLVFDGASAANGDVTPTRVIALDNLFGPTSIALDTSRDILYVADFSDRSVAVFDSASTLNATPTADRVFSGTGTDLPTGIFCDAASDRLYVASGPRDFVAAFDSASSANGSVTASRVVTGPNTQLLFPVGMAVDSAGNLFVGNRGSGDVTVYQPGANGNVAPSAVLDQVFSGIAFPAELAIADGSTLVVADDLLFAVRTFFAPAVANNAGVPVKIIQGSNTRLFFPFGLTVDPNR